MKFIIALLMFIGMLFETLGVGLVVPVVSLLIDCKCKAAKSQPPVHVYLISRKISFFVEL